MLTYEPSTVLHTSTGSWDIAFWNLNFEQFSGKWMPSWQSRLASFGNVYILSNWKSDLKPALSKNDWKHKQVFHKTRWHNSWKSRDISLFHALFINCGKSSILTQMILGFRCLLPQLYIIKKLMLFPVTCTYCNSLKIDDTFFDLIKFSFEWVLLGIGQLVKRKGNRTIWRSFFKFVFMFKMNFILVIKVGQVYTF